jgi:TRAP-type C4-dicarboxylate transport system substrate-binding protein
MNRKLGLFGAMLLPVALLLSGCTSEGSATEGLQPISMRVTTDTPDVMPQGVAATWFGEELAKRIPGSDIKIYNASSLYNNPDSLEAMSSGTLEACWASLSKTTGVIPQGLALRMPALFSTYDQAKMIPNTDLGKYLGNAAAERGFVALGWGLLSPYIGVGCQSRVLTIDDWSGLKLRCYEPQLQTLQASLAGASPVSMAWGEFVPSVQSGVVDAGYTSLSSWGPVKETVPYFTCFGIVPDYYVFLVAEDWWNGLPAGTQEIVRQVAEEACAMQVELQYESDMKQLDEVGTEDPTQVGVYVLSDQELEPYKDLWLEKVRAKAIEAIGEGGEEAIELAIRTAEELA